MRKKFVGLRLRFVENGLTQAEVAKAAGIAQSTLSARLAGKSDFTTGEITRIADLLEIPPEKYGSFFFNPGGGKREGVH